MTQIYGIIIFFVENPPSQINFISKSVRVSQCLTCRTEQQTHIDRSTEKKGRKKIKAKNSLISLSFGQGEVIKSSLIHPLPWRAITNQKLQEKF